MVLMVYSGARGTLIYEKNLKSKFSCQTPFKRTMARGWGVEGSTVEGYMLCLTKNSHHQSPAQTLYFLTYYTATKNSFTLPEITIGEDKIHGLSAHFLRPNINVSIDFKTKSKPLKPA
jgi:hypothetical protein